MDKLPPNFIKDFDEKFNKEGGINPEIPYENAVACVLSDILEIPCQNIRGRFSFLVNTENRMAIFQQTVRRRCMLCLN